MTPITIFLPDSLKAFAEEQAAALGQATIGDYLSLLLRDVRHKAISVRLDALLLFGQDSPASILNDALLEKMEAEAALLLTQTSGGARP